MADGKQTTSLEPFERRAAALAGTALLIVALVITYQPPLLTTAPDSCPEDSPSCTVEVETPQENLALSVIGLGSVLVAFAANGRRLSTVKLGENDLTFDKEEQAATDAASTPKVVAASEPDAGAPAVAAVVGPDTPEPTRARRVEVGGVELDVVLPENIPLEVLSDLVQHAAGAAALSRAVVGDLEYAARRKGRGNFPWIFRLRSGVVLKLSYGGQGKATPTVTAV